MKPLLKRFGWLALLGFLLTPSLSAVAAPHGFVVYSHSVDVPDSTGKVQRGSCLEWESLPDHRVRRLIGPEHPRLFQGDLGGVTIDATGRFMAFLAGKKPAAPRHLWILRLSDGSLTPCHAGTAVLSYQWSPLGSRLAVTANSASAASLFLVDPKTGRSVRTGIQNPQVWAWSPEARSLAYVEAGRVHLNLFSLASRRVLSRWSLPEPSDATLCFSSPRRLFVLQGPTLYWAAAGHPLVRVSSLLREPVETGQVALSPKGDHLAFETAVNFTGDDPRSLFL